VRQSAIILTNGMLETPFAKTTHGLVRGPSRFDIVGVVDPPCAGRDAGSLLDGQVRNIPIFASVAACLEALDRRPDYCIVGVATVGGVLPDAIRDGLLEAARSGLSLVNGLHRLLADDEELAELTRRNGAQIIDLRRPKPIDELRFWSGEVLRLPSLHIAVLGTDCALGKRTTGELLRQACQEEGIAAEMIYTGQTGWLQGTPYGFIFDATPNDFVCGELERAILACHEDLAPDVMLLEGQSGLRNPAGPCGAELILGGAAETVILQHAPGREYYEDLDELGCRIPPVPEEVEMIRLMGAEVIAVTLNHEGLDREQLRREQQKLQDELGLPVLHPLWDGVSQLVELIRQRLEERSKP
jgi:uncharacterized NAD-dependent epimerase/dehydratase family protein